MKNYLKKALRKKAQEPQEPRTLEDIRKDYSELSARAANAQYLVFIHSKELEQLNGQLMHLNQEAAARQKLDTPQKEEQPNG